MAVIDGQHRKYAAEMLGLEKVPAIVVYGLTIQQEALIRYFLNRKSTITDWKEEDLAKVIHVAYPNWDNMSNDEKAAAVSLENAPSGIREIVERQLAEYE